MRKTRSCYATMPRSIFCSIHNCIGNVVESALKQFWLQLHVYCLY